MKLDRNLVWIPIAAILLMLLISVGYIYDFFMKQLPWTFYPGFILGVVLIGIPSYRYIMKIWDPATLSAKEPHQGHGKNSKGWMWGPPLGVLVANVIIQLFGREIIVFVGGLTLGWLSMVFVLPAFQVWHHCEK
jgi:hypothetical protein